MKQEQNGYSNLVLAAALEREALSPKDKAFVSALFYGVTERLLTLDWALSRCLSKPLQSWTPRCGRCCAAASMRQSI